MKKITNKERIKNSFGENENMMFMSLSLVIFRRESMAASTTMNG